MVEPIYCLKPAWCGRHLAGLRPETGLTVRYGATAFKAVGYHLAIPHWERTKKTDEPPPLFNVSTGALRCGIHNQPLDAGSDPFHEPGTREQAMVPVTRTAQRAGRDRLATCGGRSSGPSLHGQRRVGISR